MSYQSDQLDLFRDSGAVMLANEVVDALLARDRDRALSRLEALQAEDPDGSQHADLGVLCSALREWPPAAAGPEQIDGVARRLEAKVQPSAERAMARRAAQFMQPFWADLAQAAQPFDYEARWPEGYTAGLWLRAGDYGGAERAAEAIPEWERCPDALHWLAVARHRLGGLGACRPVLFRLALQAPERLRPVISEIDSLPLHKDWARFWEECVWLDVHEASAPAWFPAWSLLEHPGIDWDKSAFEPPGTPAGEVFGLLARLIDLEKRGYSRALVSARGRLRALAPELFEAFMARRRSSDY